MSEPTQLDIPLEVLEAAADEAAAKAAEAQNKNIPQFCEAVAQEILNDEAVPQNVKAAVQTLTQLVHHMYMTVQQYSYAHQELHGILNIVLKPAPAPETVQ